MRDIVYVAVGLLALLVLGVSGPLRRWPVSSPLLALLVGVLLGPAVLGLVDVGTVVDEHTTFHQASRALLAVSVMAVALRYPVPKVRPDAGAAVLLVVVVMPAMALLSAGAAAVVLGTGLAGSLLLGAALSPTDPVLAASTVTGEPAEKTLPARLRHALSMESGANDGLALPLVLVAVAVAGSGGVGHALLDSLWQVVGAVGIGAALGASGGWVLSRADAAHSVEAGPKFLLTLAVALGTLGAAGLARTDGVLAVFVAGIAMNAVITSQERGLEVEADEAVNRFLVLPLFLLLGVALPWQEWQELGWAGPLFVVAILLVRRLPVVLALQRPLRLGWPDTVYLGWFGPIGVSALFYLTLEAKELRVDPPLLAAGLMVVAGSTVVHGVTSSLGLALYRRVTDDGTPRDEGRRTAPSGSRPGSA